MAKSLYYRIGQACKELDIQPYVLRYWETEFTVLSPDKSKSGQRVYSEEDLEVIRRGLHHRRGQEAARGGVEVRRRQAEGRAEAGRGV